MLQPLLLSCLQCPLTLAPLSEAAEGLVDAANRAADEQQLVQNDGELVERELMAGLVSEKWLYAVDENGAHLLAEEAIALQQPALQQHYSTQQLSKEPQGDD